MKKLNILYLLIVFVFGLCLSVQFVAAQDIPFDLRKKGLVSIGFAVSKIPGCPEDTIRMYIPDVTMCAGEEVDVPVYVDPDVAHGIGAFQFRIDFPDYEIAEPSYSNIVEMGETTRASPVVTGFDPKLCGSIVTNYIIKTETSGIIDHCLIVSYFSGEMCYKPTGDVPIFKMRIKCKKMGTARMVCLTYPEYSEYTGMWYGTSCNPAPMTYKTAHVRPGIAPKVWGMGDTTLCVKDKVRLWAEGGVQYLWEDISNISVPFDPALSEPRVQYPIFSSSEPGYHRYSVRITDTTGCYAYDTIICVVRQNDLNIEIPEDTIVDSNTIARLDVNIWGDVPPYKVKWEPAEMAQISSLDGISPNSLGNAFVSNSSKPIQEPIMFTVTASGKYCSYAIAQKINVKGSNVKGYINPFPIIRCAGSTEMETVRLNVLMQGGMGPFSYEWSYENLEPGTMDPIFEDTRMRSPEVVYFSRCAFTVRITDWSNAKIFKVSDTMQLKTPVRAAIEVIDRNGSGTFCELGKMVFTAQAQHQGTNPIYSWTVNGREAVRSEDTLFVSYSLKKGDTVACALYSNEECVQNPTQISKAVRPKIEISTYTTVLASFGKDGPDYEFCGDSLSFMLLYRNSGENFRVSWIRNDNEIAETHLAASTVEEGESGNDFVVVPRKGYYDHYSALVTESDRACLVKDSSLTTKINVKLDPKRKVEGSMPITNLGSWGEVCTGEPFMVYAKGINYLPENFVLTWFLKRKNDPVLFEMGYYSNEYQVNHTNLGDLYAGDYIQSTDGYLVTKDQYNKGFHLYLNRKVGGHEFIANEGDSIFYILRYNSACVGSGSYWSPKMPVKTLPILISNVTELITLEEINDVCEGSAITFVAKLKDAPSGHCWWQYNGLSVKINNPSWLSGLQRDTLRVPKAYKKDSISVLFASDYICSPNYRPVSIGTKMSMIKDNVDMYKSNDTIACPSDYVTLAADGLYETTAVTWTVNWANSYEDLLQGKFFASGNTIKAFADSARFGDRSEDLDKDSAIVGVLPFYVEVANSNGCKNHDSIMVNIAYKRQPTIIIDVFGGKGLWCDNPYGGQYLKVRGTDWGKKPIIGWMLHNSDWIVTDGDSIAYKPEYFKNGKPIQAAVASSMLSCVKPNMGDDVFADEDPFTYSDTLKLNIRKTPMVITAAPENRVCVGDEANVLGVGFLQEEVDDLVAQGKTDAEMYAIFEKRYSHTWTDDEGKIVGTGCFLNIVPSKGTIYTLTVQDSGKVCGLVSESVKVNLAVSTGLSLVFTDVEANKEVPFSICALADSVELSFKGLPENFSGKATLGYGVIGKNEEMARFMVYTTNPDTVFTAWFKPGDEFAYLYEHDTISCNGEDWASEVINMQSWRLPSPSFYAQRDTLLCPGENTSLRLNGALSSIWPSAPGASEIGTPPVMWQPSTYLDNPSSYTPLSSPSESISYKVYGYDEYGCLREDSVKVDVYREDQDYFKLSILSDNNLLCGEDSVFLHIDKNQSTIASSFDSIVWKRNGVPVGFGANSNKYEVLNGDSVWAEAYVFGSGCFLSAIVKSNKIYVSRYEKPQIILSASKTEICSDSVVEITAVVSSGASVKWDTVLDGGYKLISIEKKDEATYVATLKVFSDFSLSATASFNSQCLSTAEIEISVISTLDTLLLELQEVDIVCGDGDIRVALLKKTKVEKTQWYINDVLVPLSDRLEELSRAFADRDSIYVKGFSSAPCVYNRNAVSNTVVIRRGGYASIDWMAPVIVPESKAAGRGKAFGGRAAVKAMNGLVVSDCSGERELLKASVDSAYTMTWTLKIGSTENIIKPQKEIVSGKALYSAEIEYEEGLKKLMVAASDRYSCTSFDSIGLTGIKPVEMSISIKPSVSQICVGEEVVYMIDKAQKVDSIAWYVNGQEASDLYTLTYRPDSGDVVFAKVYSFAKCVASQGVVSNNVTVIVLNSNAVAPIVLDLTTTTDSLCAPQELVYTGQGDGFDFIRWYANGKNTYMENANQSEIYTWKHSPRLSSAGADSVWVMAFRRNRACVPGDTLVSKVVSVYRRMPPIVEVFPKDTLINDGETITLSASGASAFIWWPSDMIKNAEGASVEAYPFENTVIYAIGYEPYYQSPEGVSLSNVTCYGSDSVIIRVEPMIGDTIKAEKHNEIYIPNAVLPSALKVEDRVFMVHAINVSKVTMEIFNSNGGRIFNESGNAPVWDPEKGSGGSSPAGNYAYKVVIKFKSGEHVTKQGMVSVIR